MTYDDAIVKWHHSTGKFRVDSVFSYEDFFYERAPPWKHSGENPVKDVRPHVVDEKQRTLKATRGIEVISLESANSLIYQLFMSSFWFP